jgi:hypothetical protein
LEKEREIEEKIKARAAGSTGKENMNELLD